MKVWKKAVSVGLSLVMCAGMVAPAFADDAYYYVKVEGEDPEITEQDKKDGKGYNTGADGTKWVFVGKGTAPDEVEVGALEKGEDGELPEGFEAPEKGDEQNFDTGHYFVDGDRRANVDATIETFHDIGKYEYYDGEGDVPEYSYTVTWETTSTTNGFNFSSNECGEDGIAGTGNSDYFADHNIRVLLGQAAYHVDGTATLSTNPGVTVTVKMYGDEEAETVTNEDGEAATKYVLKKDAENENKELADAAVQAAVENIAGGKEDINLDNFTLEVKPVTTDDGKTAYVGEYEEKTYTVTYTVTGAQNSTTDGGTYGKQSKGDTKDADLTGYSTGAGTYTFSAWKETVDEDGNITYEAVCTFTPYFFDFDTPNEVEIDEPDVPLAGLFTRADAIGYLWQQAGEPEAELSDFPDVDADHQWAVAIGWAQDMGIALPDLEGNFRPDDLVERFVEDEELKPEGELEEFLNRYAEYAGIELDEDELFYVLGGEAADIVMGEDAQVIFDDFFAKLEAALSQAA